MDIKIVAVFEPEDAAGCHEKGAPELVVYDVPRVKVQSLASLLNYASTCTRAPKETIQSAGCELFPSNCANATRTDHFPTLHIPLHIFEPPRHSRLLTISRHI